LSSQEAARQHQLSRSLIEYWRDQYRNNAMDDRPSKRERELEAENEKLKAKIGDLVHADGEILAWCRRSCDQDHTGFTFTRMSLMNRPACTLIVMINRPNSSCAQWRERAISVSVQSNLERFSEC
jgi:hypothetical protein